MFNVIDTVIKGNLTSTHTIQVIYVKPGYEVDLDHLVQDSIRLNSSVKVYLAALQIMILHCGFQNSEFRRSYIYYSYYYCRIRAQSCVRNLRLQYNVSISFS